MSLSDSQEVKFFMAPEGSLPCSQQPVVVLTLNQTNPMNNFTPCL